MNSSHIITIDGPAGAGKSTIAKIVAKKLGYTYIDTGAMYRAITWKVISNDISFKDKKRIIETTENTEIKFKRTGDKLKIFVDGKNVTEDIRSADVTQKTNIIASIQGVRNILRAKQKQMGKSGSIVMEGRDIGTYVFPAAKNKFYLDAKPRERAMRRWKELMAKGKNVSLKDISKAIYRRDYCDKHRGISPLKQATDAVVIDSTSLTLSQVAQKILDEILK